ncbi:MAG: PTS lactose/cellobiose transporter subunit IIA [Malacoplasma sp.]
MTKKEITMIGFELVALAGEARSYLLSALNFAKENKFDEIEDLFKQAEELIIECHKKQTEMLQKEAQGDYSEVTLIMVHGQDHLMTTILLKELVGHIVDLYKKK